MWKARSHAAYHGYSHLSGIEMTSSLTMWNQLRLRIAAARPRSGVDVVLLEPAVEVEVVVLLAPQHPGQRLAHHRRLVRVVGRRGDRGVELVGLGDARGEQPLDVGEPDRAADRGTAQVHGRPVEPLGRDGQLEQGGRPPSCRCAPG